MKSRLLRWSGQIYRIVLRLYPRDYRTRFSQEHALVFDSLMQDVYRWDGKGGLVRVWTAAVLDGCWAALVQWVFTLSPRRLLAMDTNLLNIQLGDLTWCIATGLRAGYSLRQVFEVLAKGAPEPASRLCQRVLDDLDKGMDMEAALNNLKRSSPSPALVRLVDVFLAQRQTGGNLADQLEPVMEELLETEGSDPAFYTHMRAEANQLGALLPERAK